MNSEFKIFLYIIVGIGYFIVKLYRKELKKQNERHISKRPVSGRTAEDIFRELQKTLNIPGLEEEVLKPVNPSTVAERKEAQELARAKKIFANEGGPRKKPLKKIFSNEGGSKMKHYKPIQPSVLKKAYAKEISFEKSSSIIPEYGPVIEFDPRLAVIYSEILKRPQY